MAAFGAAMNAGADGFELDVRLSACGELLVFHDDDLMRLCGDPRLVRQLPWSELAGMRVSGERIPLLREVFEEFPEALVNVEMKLHPLPLEWRLVKATASVIASARARSRVLVSSFDPRLLAMLRAASRHLPRGLLYHSKQAKPFREAWFARSVAAAAVHPESVMVDAAMVARAHSQGYLLNTWTVDDPDRVRELAAIGVDAIISNDPAQTLKALQP